MAGTAFAFHVGRMTDPSSSSSTYDGFKVVKLSTTQVVVFPWANDSLVNGGSNTVLVSAEGGANEGVWLRVTYDAGTNLLSFFKSSDGLAWTLFESVTVTDQEAVGSFRFGMRLVVTTVASMAFFQTLLDYIKIRMGWFTRAGIVTAGP